MIETNTESAHYPGNYIKVTVIVPLYNKAPYIQRAIDSIFAQTIQDFEIIVVDDGSTDDGSRIVEAYGDIRLRLLRQGNQGVSSARNRGVNEAQADFIVFLDADDEWLPAHLETLFRLRETYPAAGAYADAYLIHTPNNRLMDPNYRCIPASPWEGEIPRYFLSAALGHYPLNSSVLGMKKTVFNEMNGYPPGVWYGEDAVLWAKIAVSYPIVFSWTTGAIYHWDCLKRTCSRELSLDEAPFIPFLRSFIEKNIISPSLRADIDEYISRYEIDRAFRLISIGKTEQGRKILRTCETRYRRFERAYGIFISFLPRWIRKRIRNVVSGIRSLIRSHSW